VVISADPHAKIWDYYKDKIRVVLHLILDPSRELIIRGQAAFEVHQWFSQIGIQGQLDPRTQTVILPGRPLKLNLDQITLLGRWITLFS
jgi:hypothetical protein